MIQKKNFEKGQLFSLDFMMAMAITVLAIGLLLNFYELNVYEAKEARINNEIQLVATTAANLLLESNRCNTNFEDQGYKLYGCTDESGFDSLTKQQLMIPKGFNCFITIDGPPITTPIPNCSTDAPSDTQTVVSIERTFISGTGIIDKASFENCIDGSCSGGTMAPKTLILKIWK